MMVMMMMEMLQSIMMIITNPSLVNAIPKKN